MNIRQPAVSGAFYPDQQELLQTVVTNLMSEATERELSPKVLIVPHAGYIYSGAIAASGYKQLEPFRRQIRRVVLLGPSHQLAFEGIALPDCEAYSTPIGDIPLDIDAIKSLERFSQIQTLDAAHAREHSLEVQCPFLQNALDNFKLIPLVVGDASPYSVAEIIDFLWGGEETLIVISSDLSHYLTYEEAKHRDSQTTKAIEQMSCALTGGQACGCYPLNGMLKVAQRRGMEVVTLDVRNSGDTAGDKTRVVGYGAYVIQ
ncbi:AmmeMemoRadiSam system protein B [Endozoicomonas numazuensis]|uniref:MEMO1 family protein GZ78_03425 n=1 Tax=Endozoicomonas numazuensis TaxID=1137799 RepID=A0A081NKV7_9GAMM|nr:AmmeMemoRadiSam system protein B [Endozoicomonas numazuensis]KEQ19080.1 dioxygenase [Endozoicomonas numazuensis]